MSSENSLLPRIWELERALNQSIREVESLRQQLAAALAACKVKDEALMLPCDRWNKVQFNIIKRALAIQPDEALQAFAAKVREQCSEIVRDVLREERSTLSYDDASEIQNRILALELTGRETANEY